MDKYSNPPHKISPAQCTGWPFYLLNERMILAEMCRKNIEPMKERERIRTTNGSLKGTFSIRIKRRADG
jgi:hypothetical protein